MGDNAEQSEIARLNESINNLKNDISNISRQINALNDRIYANAINIDSISSRLSTIENNGINTSVRQIKYDMSRQNQKIRNLEKNQKGI